MSDLDNPFAPPVEVEPLIDLWKETGELIDRAEELIPARGWGQTKVPNSNSWIQVDSWRDNIGSELIIGRIIRTISYGMSESNMALQMVQGTKKGRVTRKEMTLEINTWDEQKIVKFNHGEMGKFSEEDYKLWRDTLTEMREMIDPTPDLRLHFRRLLARIPVLSDLLK